MSNRKNLANAILALGVSTSDTTWVLESGYGDEMPDVPFDLTATPFGQLSTMGNSEIVRVTAVSTDTLTVERAQKGTTAKAFLAGAVVSNGISTDDVVGTMVNVTTANNTAAKVGTTDNGNFIPTLGDKIIVNFVNGSNVASPTLNIDGSGAKNIRLGQTNASTATMGLGTTAGSNVKVAMWYDGTYWQLYGANDNTNTTYSEIPEAEIDTGTASTARAISGRRAAYIITKAVAAAVSAVQALTNWVTTAMLQNGSVTSDKIDWATLSDGSSYIKIGENLQICWGQTVGSGVGVNVIYPRPFASTPYAAFTDVVETTSAGNGSFIRGITATSITIKTSTAENRAIFWLAIGAPAA